MNLSLGHSPILIMKACNVLKHISSKWRYIN
jgi:hypothetical protein